MNRHEEILEEIKKLHAEAMALPKQEEFKVGDYFIREGWRECYKIVDVKDSGNTVVIEYFDTMTNSKQTDTYFVDHNFRKATPSEIEKHLIEKAEKKGLIVGAFVRHGCSNLTIGKIEFISSSLNNSNNSGAVKKYLKTNGSNFLVAHGDGSYDYCVPLNECEIIKTLELKIGEYDVHLHSDHITVGCTRVELETIKKNIRTLFK
jgi:hypothetical protein